MTMLWSGAEKSNTFSPVSSSYTIVPTGTFRRMSSPSRPVRLEPSPWRPRSALYSGLKRKWTSVLWRSLDSMMTSPPLPPSPPEGPPRGTYFSRRKAMQPLPPSPALTRIFVSSMNMVATKYLCKNKSLVPKARLKPRWTARRGREHVTDSSGRKRELLGNLHGLNHHKLAHRTFVQEFNPASNLGEQSVVLAAAYVQSGLYASAALPDDNRSTGDDLPAECFESQPLGIRVAAVS